MAELRVKGAKKACISRYILGLLFEKGAWVVLIFFQKKMKMKEKKTKNCWKKYVFVPVHYSIIRFEITSQRQRIKKMKKSEKKICKFAK